MLDLVAMLDLATPLAVLADRLDALGPGARAVLVAYGGAFAAGLATICFFVLFLTSGQARDTERAAREMLARERHDV
jgi:hypothetical protein